MSKPVSYAIAVVFLLACWELAAFLLDTPALPSVQETLPVLARYAQEMLPDLAISLYRVVASIALGTLVGMPVGLAIGRSPRADKLCAPVLYILYPLPKIVLLPIFLVLLGLGDAPKIVLISLTIFFQVVVVMRDAAKAIPDSMTECVVSLGGTRRDVWRHVIIPATLPNLFTTLRVSTGIAIAILFFAEAIAGSTGLGYFIMESWAMVNYPRMFAGIIMLAVLGVVLYELFEVLERRTTRWNRA